jgi:hypothetical protein
MPNTCINRVRDSVTLRLITNTEQSRAEESRGEKSIVSPSTESNHETLLVMIQSSINSHIITFMNIKTSGGRLFRKVEDRIMQYFR